MEFNHPGKNQQASPRIPQPSDSSCFTQQTPRAGYMGSEMGRNQLHLFPDQLHSHPHPFHHPYRQPHDMREAIQREIEKERIREEIIVSEIVRRRVLEAEVRRELMMERESALRRGGDGFPFGSSPQTGFDSAMRFSVLGTRSEGRSLEERIAMSLEERKRLNGMRESGGFGTLPVRRGTADLKITEVKPVSEGAKEKQKIIFLAKPDENISGSKRKAVTLDASELPSNVNVKKKAQKEWSCDLCQVSATSERGLNEHMQGKKHKSKEAALRAQKTGKNYIIGLFPKRATKSIQLPEAVDLGTEQGVKLTAQSPPLNKTGDKSLKTQNSPSLQENPNPDNLKNNQSKSVQKNGDPKNRKYRFWCEMCEVGAFSQLTMDAHEKGKKHVNRLKGRDRKGGAAIAVVVNHAEWVAAEDGESKTKDNVNGTLDKTRSEDHKLVDAVKPQDHKLMEETKVEDGLVDPEFKEDVLIIS